jgi:DNA-directed RNA polymerase subunit H (RpoH/RPB5)
MRISELFGLSASEPNKNKHRLIDDFEIWTTNEEAQLLKKIKNHREPVKISQLEEHEQFRVQAMIRKSLLTKIGMTDPSVVANEKK